MFRLTDANEDNRLEAASLTVKERQRDHLAPATGIIARGCVYRGLYAFENGGVTVGHDAVIGDHSRVGAGAFIGGHTVIGENAFIGSGALLKDRIHIGDASVVAIGSAVFSDVAANTTVMGNPARVTNEGAQGLLYAPSRALAEAAPSGEQSAAAAPEALGPDRIAELYWEAFSACFEGTDFNPVSFRFHDDGWDSITQMSLICRLEETFHISFKGRETMKINSYQTGFELVRKKLESAKK